jgi:imidazole glycerol-phosphate synthase subunit HisH
MDNESVMQGVDFLRQNSSKSMSLPTGKIVVIDAGFGNVGSVLNALEVLDVEAKLSHDPNALRTADALILPGVGSFADGMRQLETLGLIPILNDCVITNGKPFLGICLGMQLLAKHGEEGGDTAGLGWIDADVVRFVAVSQAESDSGTQKPLKIPHVGWNDVQTVIDDPILGAKGSKATYYFVHSYHLQVNDPALTLGVCDYGGAFPAVVRKNNIWGMQFHPEKSHRAGLRLLANFLKQMKPDTSLTC